MLQDELNHLRQSLGEFISINSFFSTSINRQQALGFLNSSSITDDLHRVLFVIDADPCVVTTKPFADISSASFFSDECEVLFMIGCTFRLIDVRQNDDQIWMIRMKLCGDDEHELKNLFDHMKKEYGCGENKVNLRSFGDVLRRMDTFYLAEKVYCRLLKELSPNDPLLSHYWRSTCKFQNDNNQALEWFTKAIKLFNKANDENHSCMAGFYSNIGVVYRSQDKCSEALNYFEKSLAIQEKHLPSDHSDMGRSHNNIGNLYYHLGQYDLAMEHYNRALEIWSKSLTPQHPDIAMSYENIGNLHYKKDDLKQALTYYEKAAVIYRHSLPSEHPNVIEIKRKIVNVSTKLK